MKVRKDQLHKDLQPLYFRLSMMTRILCYRPAIRVIDVLVNRFLKGRNTEGLQCSEVHIPSSDGETQIRVRIYRPEDHEGPLPLLLYIHGGGYIMGIPEMSAELIKNFIDTRPCVVVAPDYRKSFTKPFPAGLDDCYDALLWARDNAESLGAIAHKVIVAGHSAGGGLTAAVTLRARDEGDVDISFQMPIYPMIDDQQPCEAYRAVETPIWNTTMNRIGWDAYLSDLKNRGEDIPAYAAPARNHNYHGFPPTITLVGNLEPFYWETEAYVKALREAGVEVLYELYQGCFHAFDSIAADTAISRQALDFTFRSYGEFYDRYI